MSLLQAEAGRKCTGSRQKGKQQPEDQGKGLSLVELEPGEQKVGQRCKGSWEGEQLPGQTGLRPSLLLSIDPRCNG